MKRENQFGQAFKRARKASDLSQEGFSQESGRTYISEIERGLKHPTVQKVDELSYAMGIHPLTVLALAYLPKGGTAALEKLLSQVRLESEQIFLSEGKRRKRTSRDKS